MKTTYLLSFLLALVSCGKTKTEERNDAVDVALSYLTDQKCDKAIDLLEKVGRDPTDGIYVQVLASAYACRAGYNEVVFLGTDIDSLGHTQTDFLASLTMFSTSHEHSADSASYGDLRTGIHLLLNSSTAQPSQAARTASFGTRRAGDMGMQALFLSFVQLGKFLQFYANNDDFGNKGLGSASVDEQTATPSQCFIKYTNAQAVAYVDGSGHVGPCRSTDAGHPNLSLTATNLTTTKRRMCEGLMLVTNIMNILEEITLPTGDVFASLGDLKTTVADFKSTVSAYGPDIATLMSTTSQSNCESLISTSAQFDNMQILYSVLFETGLQ